MIMLGRGHGWCSGSLSTGLQVTPGLCISAHVSLAGAYGCAAAACLQSRCHPVLELSAEREQRFPPGTDLNSIVNICGVFPVCQALGRELSVQMFIQSSLQPSEVCLLLVLQVITWRSGKFFPLQLSTWTNFETCRVAERLKQRNNCISYVRIYHLIFCHTSFSPPPHSVF